MKLFFFRFWFCFVGYDIVGVIDVYDIKVWIDEFFSLSREYKRIGF